MSRLLIYWFYIPKCIKCTVRLYIRQSNGRRSYHAVSFLNPKIRIAKVHEITFSSASWLVLGYTEKKTYLAARNLFRLNTACPFTTKFNSRNSLYFAYMRDWSRTLGQLSCTIAAYMRNWKCYIVHSDGEHEMLCYNWSPWLVTGITTSRYGHPTTNLLYLAVSYTTPLTRHRNAL